MHRDQLKYAACVNSLMMEFHGDFSTCPRGKCALTQKSPNRSCA